VIEFDSVHIPLESRVVSSWPAQLMHASLQWSLGHVFTDRMAYADRQRVASQRVESSKVSIQTWTNNTCKEGCCVTRAFHRCFTACMGSSTMHASHSPTPFALLMTHSACMHACVVTVGGKRIRSLPSHPTLPTEPSLREHTHNACAPLNTPLRPTHL
jgi:hypothetical protein